MDHPRKKALERRILDEVYGDNPRLEIIDSESPDFLLRNGRRASCFGVEVTEFFYTETNARLERIPGYVTDLLEGKPVKHKDDSRLLDITAVEITDPNGAALMKNVPAVIQSLPSLTQCARQVAERVLAKSERIESSTAIITHVNLVINDRTRLPMLVSKEEFYSAYFVPELVAALSKARFREVYLIADFPEGRSFARLKMLLLLAELYFFHGAVADGHFDELSTDEVEFLDVFASYFVSRVRAPVLVRRGRLGPEVVFGDSGVTFSEDGSLKVKIYADGPIPSDAEAPSVRWDTVLGKRFGRAAEEYRESHKFVIGAVFPVKRSAV